MACVTSCPKMEDRASGWAAGIARMIGGEGGYDGRERSRRGAVAIQHTSPIRPGSLMNTKSFRLGPRQFQTNDWFLDARTRKIRCKYSTGFSAPCPLRQCRLRPRPVRNQDKPTAPLSRTMHGLRLAHTLARTRRLTPLMPLQHPKYVRVLGRQCGQHTRLCWIS
jgi:hypothetical protein